MTLTAIHATPEKQQSEKLLRIGIIIDNVFCQKHVYEFVEWANKKNQLCVSYVIVNQTINNSQSIELNTKRFRTTPKNSFYNKLSKVFFNTLPFLEQFLLMVKKGYKDEHNKFNLTSVVKNHQLITFNNDLSLEATEIEKIKELNLDLIVNYCGGTLCGSILNAARVGMLSIEYAGGNLNCETLIGFWEVYWKQDTTEFSIMHLTDDSVGGGKSLFRGESKTELFYLLNKISLHRKANNALKLLITKIATEGKLPAYLPSTPCSDPIYDIPKLHIILYYLIQLLYRLCIKELCQLIGYRLQFNIAFVSNDWRHARLCQGISLKNLPHHFLADPFVITRFGRNYCFAEDYDFSTKMGNIVVYELGEKSSERIGIALEEPFHLSFPYLFEFQDDLYMCPETSNKKEIRIYKCLDFPCQWQLESVAMTEVSAVDSMIFEKNGLWWMLTNIDLFNIGDYTQGLSIFYADSPLSSDWKAHPKNPIFIASTSVRNGGLLKEGDRIFRVGQAPGFNLYGKKTSIFEIIEINEFNYTEAHLTDINPLFKKDIIGTHHLHSNGKITVFDYINIGW